MISRRQMLAWLALGMALLTGCVQSVLDPDINWATLRVLAANGVETVIPQGQGCCC